MARGSIIKRGQSWLLKYDIGRDFVSGKRQVRYKTIQGNKKDAERELNKLLSQVNEGAHVDSSNKTLAEAASAFIRKCEGRRLEAKTIERYSEILKLHIIPTLGKVPIQQLKAVHFSDLYLKLRLEGKAVRDKRTGLSERTLLHVHRVLRQVFEESLACGELGSNPVSKRIAPKPKRSQMNVLSKEDFARLLVSLEESWLQPLVALAGAIGARRGELLALRWSDLDLNAGLLRIERSVEDTKKNGIAVKAPKNESSARTVKLDADTLALLRWHRGRQAEVFFQVGVAFPRDALLFPKDPLHPHALMAPRWVTKAFSIKAKAAGFAKLRFHDIRHTSISNQLLDRVPVNAVASRVGHKSAKMTLDVYGHVLAQAELEAAAAGGAMLGGLFGKRG